MAREQKSMDAYEALRTHLEGSGFRDQGSRGLGIRGQGVWGLGVKGINVGVVLITPPPAVVLRRGLLGQGLGPGFRVLLV